MIHRISPRDLAVLAGGFVQGRFSKLGDAGGIDLQIVTDEEGIHGKYEGRDFSLSLSEVQNHIRFKFKMGVPPDSGQEGEHNYPNLSRLIGETYVEQKKGNYLAQGLIRKHPQQIRSANDVLNDLWIYVMKEPFSRAHIARDKISV